MRASDPGDPRQPALGRPERPGERPGQAESLADAGPIIKPAVDEGKLRVVPAVYDIETRRVSLV